MQLFRGCTPTLRPQAWQGRVGQRRAGRGVLYSLLTAVVSTTAVSYYTYNYYTYACSLLTAVVWMQLPRQSPLCPVEPANSTQYSCSSVLSQVFVI